MFGTSSANKCSFGVGCAKVWKQIQKKLQFWDGMRKSSEKVWKKARDGYISKPTFEPGAVKKVSLAASALCIWAIASSKYQIVTKKVAPKKAKHAEVTAVLNEAQAEL